MTQYAFGRKVRVTIYSPVIKLLSDERPSNPIGAFIYDALKPIDKTISSSQIKNSYVFESDITQGKRGLKIVGTVTKYFATQPPEATVDIYNLSANDVANILALRMVKIGNQYVEKPLRIKIEAGYTQGYFAEIFDGQIVKPNMMRPDANNTVLRLVCINGAEFMAAGSALTQTFNDGVNFYEIAQKVANNSNLPIYISDKLKDYKVDGEFVTSVTDYDTLTQISEETGVVFSYYDSTAYFNTYDNILDIFKNKQQDAIVLNSKTGLVNFPQLTNDGITVQSVLNPKLNVFGLIKLNNGDISIDQPAYLSEREIGAWLSGDGLYIITQVTHQFDTTTSTFTSTCKCLARDYITYLE